MTLSADALQSVQTVAGKPKVEMSPAQKRRMEFKEQQAAAMKMMMAAIKNPDPTDSNKGLKPQDMLQMTSHIMGIENQINEAEEKEKLRLTLERFMASQDQHLVGKHIRTESDSVFVGKDGALLAYEITDDDIVETELKILNDKNEVLLSLDGERAKGTHRIQWDGKDKDGALVEPGAYSLLAVGKDAERKTSFLTTFAYPRVQELETEGKGSALILQYPDKSLERRPYDSSKESLSIAAPYVNTTA